MMNGNFDDIFIYTPVIGSWSEKNRG